MMTGSVYPGLPQLLRQPVAVQLRHHDVADQQVDVRVLHDRERLRAVFRLIDLVSVFRQVVAHQFPQTVIVLRHQNMEHPHHAPKKVSQVHVEYIGFL